MLLLLLILTSDIFSFPLFITCSCLIQFTLPSLQQLSETAAEIPRSPHLLSYVQYVFDLPEGSRRPLHTELLRAFNVLLRQKEETGKEDLYRFGW
jgi:hypothetical protein